MSKNEQNTTGRIIITLALVAGGFIAFLRFHADPVYAISPAIAYAFLTDLFQETHAYGAGAITILWSASGLAMAGGFFGPDDTVRIAALALGCAAGMLALFFMDKRQTALLARQKDMHGRTRQYVHVRTVQFGFATGVTS
jgi:hypothetical protein